MRVLLLEVRDRGTFLPCFAMRMTPATQCSPEKHESQRFLLRRAGYSCEPNDDILLFGRMQGGECRYDPYDWGDSRTMKNAHQYVQKYFDGLQDGDVIDVEFILGETTEKKITERLA